MQISFASLQLENDLREIETCFLPLVFILKKKTNNNNDNDNNNDNNFI